MLCVQNAYLQKSTIKRTGYNDDIYFNIKEHTCTTVPVKLPKCQSFLQTFIKASALFHMPCEYVNFLLLVWKLPIGFHIWNIGREIEKPITTICKLPLLNRAAETRF